MTEAVRTLTLVGAALVLSYGWMAVQAARVPSASAERLVAEFRTMRLGCLLLAFMAGTYVGLTIAAGPQTGPAQSLDIVLSVGFLAAAAAALTLDPRAGLTLLAVAFGMHALYDITHRPGLLPQGMVPRWYAAGCATSNLVLGALSYLPIMRR